MDVVHQPIGSEGSLDIKLEGGKVKFTISHNHASGSVSLVAVEDAKYFLEKLKAVIPGTVDDMIIEVAKSALP